MESKEKILVGQSSFEFSPNKIGCESLTVLYAVQGANSLTDSQLEKLNSIIDIKPLNNESGNIVYIMPRPGMQTPTSSKIGDALEACGLSGLNVEKILRYRLKDGTTLKEILPIICDRMQQVAEMNLDNVGKIFEHGTPGTIKYADILNGGLEAIRAFNSEEKFGLNDNQLQFLYKVFTKYGRNPTDLELMCFAQSNSEHCRHGTFNAHWTIDGQEMDKSMFQMIKDTHKTQVAKGNHTTLSAYSDNAAVFEGGESMKFIRTPDGEYTYDKGIIHILGKVETHNHPTSISSYPGAATGSGGEIRDEGAVGRGSKPKAGLTGFITSNLNIPGFEQPWETPIGRPLHVESAFQIMTTGPLGSAAFNNEFGRTGLTGFFRTFGMNIGGVNYGYHKPIMLAGGIGSITPENITKSDEFSPGTLFVQLGGPGLPVGLGGGNASSQNLGTGDVNLDFASVQRDNAEMQRRCQEVINACATLKENNPILSIHDVGAGGVGNALPELAHTGGVGAIFDLRKIPIKDNSMSPKEIWSNEAQERYTIAISPEKIKTFEAICNRERAPFAVVGYATEQQNIIVMDSGKEIMNMTVEDLLEAKVLTHISASRPALAEDKLSLDLDKISLKESCERVLSHPAVADKTWLINIGDRTVGGLTSRDQMVGPWQVPVADVAVTLRDHIGFEGEAMAIGERTPLSIFNPQAAGRMAIGECITNMLSADIRNLGEMKFSGNWMAAIKNEGEKTKLYDAVQALSELCLTVGVEIPVGKDSLSMETTWTENGEKQTVTSPVSPILSGFVPVNDVRKTLTPELKRDKGETELILVDLGIGKNRLGGSILAQVWKKFGNITPDIDGDTLKSFVNFMLSIHKNGLALAYHDRGDGGLFATLLEMAFTSHSGLDIDIEKLGEKYSALFSEELGAVLQIKSADKDGIFTLAKEYNLDNCTFSIGKPNFGNQKINIVSRKEILLSEERVNFQKIWSKTSYLMQANRDNAITAKQEFERLSEINEPVMPMKLTFDVSKHPAHDIIKKSKSGNLPKPRVAILREQGVNGHEEMAAAFVRAGFEAIDVTMTDIIEGRKNLKDYRGIAACGGFSYGDVLGAGRARAQTILNNPELLSQFSEFFKREDTFGIGVCNGNQMLSQLKNIIPGASHWPTFGRNEDGRFKARYSPILISPSDSIFLKGMAGSIIPMVSAHGEGKASGNNGAVMQYADNHGKATNQYPQNPNGSPDGATGFTTKDGRFTTMMPHPERIVRSVQCSWLPSDYTNEDAPWMQAFYNLRVWAEENR